MNLDRVTITGADESIISLHGLAELNEEFPFVEWGILTSDSRMGSPRYPSRRWIDGLREMLLDDAALSLHVCGKWAREILEGNNLLPPGIADGFQRIQLNVREDSPCNPPVFYRAVYAMGEKQFIFQTRGRGNTLIGHLYDQADLADSQVDAVSLFDTSGGKGIAPSEWPEPFYMEDDETYCYHGYAGGLGPHNLEQQLPLIEKASAQTRIWVDMETHVRSENDSVFDLDKVRHCLEVCAPFVKASVKR